MINQVACRNDSTAAIGAQLRKKYEPHNRETGQFVKVHHLRSIAGNKQLYIHIGCAILTKRKIHKRKHTGETYGEKADIADSRRKRAGRAREFFHINIECVCGRKMLMLFLHLLCDTNLKAKCFFFYTFFSVHQSTERQRHWSNPSIQFIRFNFVFL